MAVLERTRTYDVISCMLIELDFRRMNGILFVSDVPAYLMARAGEGEFTKLGGARRRIRGRFTSFIRC